MIKLSLDHDVYRTWGTLYANVQDYPKSLIKLRKALAIDPNSIIAIEAFAGSFQALNKHEEALIYFKKALDLDPTSLVAHEGVLNSLKGLERLKDNELFYEEILNQNPNINDDFYFHSTRAQTLVKFKEYPAAFASYKKAIEINPNDHSIHFQYGMALYQQFCFQESLYEFETAATIEPFSQDTRNNVAFLKYHLGEVPEAIAILEDIIENKLENFTTFPNMILFQYYLHQNEEVLHPYFEKLKPLVKCDHGDTQRVYMKDLELTERMMKDCSDETKKNFYLKKIDGLKMLFSVIDKLRS